MTRVFDAYFRMIRFQMLVCCVEPCAALPLREARSRGAYPLQTGSVWRGEEHDERQQPAPDRGQRAPQTNVPILFAIGGCIRWALLPHNVEEEGVAVAG